MTARLIWAMLAYAVLAAMASYTLGDASVVVGQGRVEMRLVVWIMLGGFALTESADPSAGNSPSPTPGESSRYDGIITHRTEP